MSRVNQSSEKNHLNKPAINNVVKIVLIALAVQIGLFASFMNMMANAWAPVGFLSTAALWLVILLPSIIAAGIVISLIREKKILGCILWITLIASVIVSINGGWPKLAQTINPYITRGWTNYHNLDCLEHQTMPKYGGLDMAYYMICQFDQNNGETFKLQSEIVAVNDKNYIYKLYFNEQPKFDDQSAVQLYFVNNRRCSESDDDYISMFYLDGLRPASSDNPQDNWLDTRCIMMEKE